jgi:hypothetical protein
VGINWFVFEFSKPIGFASLPRCGCMGNFFVTEAEAQILLDFLDSSGPHLEAPLLTIHNRLWSFFDLCPDSSISAEGHCLNSNERPAVNSHRFSNVFLLTSYLFQSITQDTNNPALTSLLDHEPSDGEGQEQIQSNSSIAEEPESEEETISARPVPARPVLLTARLRVVNSDKACLSNVITLGLVNQIRMGLSNSVLYFGEFINTRVAARKPLADTPHHAVRLKSPLAKQNFRVPEKFRRHENI